MINRDINTKLKEKEVVLAILKTQLTKLEKENLYLGELHQVAKTLIAKFMSVCSSCHRNLIRIDWNSTGYLLTCDAMDCSKYRQPSGTIQKDDIRKVCELQIGKE